MSLNDNWKGVTISEGTLKAIEILEKIFNSSLPMEGLREEYLRLSLAINERDEDELYEAVFVYLNDIAPEGYHFGAHPGDGACFGFWENED